MEELKCGYCLADFTTQKYLQKHQKDAKYCKKYKDVLFVCKKCKFTVNGIKNIEDHIDACESDVVFDNPFMDYENIIKRLEEERRLFQIKSTTLEEQIKKSSSVLVQLQVEQIKNKIYRNIIENNTTIKIEDSIEELDDGLHIYINSDEIPIHIHELSPKKTKKVKIKKKSKKTGKTTCKKTGKTTDKKTGKTTGKKTIKTVKIKVENKPVESKVILSHNSSKNTSPDSDSKTKKISYKTIKNCLKLVEEPTDEDLKSKIDEIDDNLRVVYNIKSPKKTLEKCFDNIAKTRNPNNHLETLKNSRSELMPGMSLKNYLELLEDNSKKLGDVLKDKKYSEKKISNSICKSMNSLDMRLLNHGNSYKTMHVDVDEIRRFRLCLNFSVKSPKKFEPFDASKLYHRFYNYGSAIFTLKENMENYLFNIYGFNNLIYVPLPKSSDSDPYSFYSLEKITNGIRNWKMECRLENLSNDFIFNVRPYFISLFRKLYCDVFHDNEYRKDYAHDSQLTENDCEQLLQSIFILSKPSEFYKIFRVIVKNKATYSPTVNDKFNLHGDDTLQKRRLNGPSNDPELVDIVKQLFDGISIENAVDFYRSRTI